MKWAWILFFSTIGLAQNIPDPVITATGVQNSYVTLAGRLKSVPGKPVGISVEHGRIHYTTLTDVDGRWGIVVRYQSNQLTVVSWDLFNPQDRGGPVSLSLEPFSPRKN